MSHSCTNRVGRMRGQRRGIWATGAAVLYRIGAINWDSKEYILGETDHFVSEINPPHRRVITGATEQLAETSIVLAWSRPDKILLLGTDNRNVPEWTKKGYAKKGASLLLGQMASRWISKSVSQVEGFYLRSGRNFSPDWLTRACWGQLKNWTTRFVFARVRPKRLWGQTVNDFRCTTPSELHIPDIRTILPGKEKSVCVEWNGEGRSCVEAGKLFVAEI